MLTLFLERSPTDTQTSGILTMPSGREFYTLECPWRNNRPFESCIPDGAYLIEPWNSPTHGKCYIVSGGLVGDAWDEARLDNLRLLSEAMAQELARVNIDADDLSMDWIPQFTVDLLSD